MSLSVSKRNKRLWVMDAETVIYSPPDFLRSRCTRDWLHSFCDKIENKGMSRIAAVIWLETSLRPCK